MRYVKLGDIINYLPKSKIKASEGRPIGMYPFFTSSKILSKYLDYFIYDNECLIFGTGGNATVNYYNGKFATSTDNFIVTVSASFNTKFIYYYLNRNIKILEKGFKGAGIKHISKEYINNIKVPYIPLDKQIKAVNILDKIENAINIKTVQMNRLNELIKSQFVEMFGSEHEGFKYNTVEFSKCVSNMLKGPFGSDIKKSLYVSKSNDTYKVYIQINAIKRDETLGNYYISKEYFDRKMFKFELKPLDYIVTCDGTLGKLLRLDENMEKGIISTSLLKITLNEKIGYKYFEEIWDQYMLRSLNKNIRNACLTHLPSARVIGTLCIPLPPIELQNRFGIIVEQIDKQKYEFEKSLKRLGELKSSLMQEYFG